MIDGKPARRKTKLAYLPPPRDRHVTLCTLRICSSAWHLKELVYYHVPEIKSCRVQADFPKGYWGSDHPIRYLVKVLLPEPQTRPRSIILREILERAIADMPAPAQSRYRSGLIGGKPTLVRCARS